MTGSRGRRLAATLAATTAAVLLCGAPRSNATSVSPKRPTLVATGTTVRLTESGRGTTRTFTASLRDARGRPISGAELDLGALTDDPDLRVRTTPLVELASRPGRYRAHVEFPEAGSWVVVVRVHTPFRTVELFSQTVAGGAKPAPHLDDPSHRAVRSANPEFYELYRPGGLALGGSALGGSALGGSGAATHHDKDPEHHQVDWRVLLQMLVHTVGALAWLGATLGLVLVTRVRSGASGLPKHLHEAGDSLTRRYALVAGIALLVLVLGGFLNVADASPGLTHPTTLTSSASGRAYLAVFGVKMLLVFASLLITLRIALLLRPAGMAIVGRLAGANAALGSLIIVCVAVLNQLHLALH